MPLIWRGSCGGIIIPKVINMVSDFIYVTSIIFQRQYKINVQCPQENIVNLRSVVLVQYKSRLPKKPQKVFESNLLIAWDGMLPVKLLSKNNRSTNFIKVGRENASIWVSDDGKRIGHLFKKIDRVVPPVSTVWCNVAYVAAALEG